MATTVATVVQDIKDRLNIGVTPGQPTDAMLTRWVIASAKWAVGQLQPPTEATTTVLSNSTASHPASLVYFVANGHHLLLDSEWTKRDNLIVVQPHAAAEDDVLTVWSFVDPAIADDATTFDTSCIFGTDWLEELITVMAAIQAEQRLATRAASVDASGHASAMRVLQDERNQLLAPYKQVRAEWLALMQQRLAARIQTGDGPLRTSGLSRFANRSSVVTPLTRTR